MRISYDAYRNEVLGPDKTFTLGAPPAGVRLTGWLGLVVDDSVITKILDDGVQFDLEPPLENREGSIFRPRVFVSMPTEKLAFKHFDKYTFQHPLGLVVVLELWNEIGG